MHGPGTRAVALVALFAVLATGCTTFASSPDFAKPEASVRKPSSSDAPTSTPSATADPVDARPTEPAEPIATVDPASVAGPPFPQPLTGVSIYDRADIFSEATEELAAARIAEITERQDAQLFVFTQYKPGSDAVTTEQDARALSVQWGIRNGLVIMWNTTRSDCTAGAGGNGQIQLYAGARYSSLHLSEEQRQEVFDDEMVPLLGDCKLEDALTAALEAILAAAEAAPPPSSGPGGQGACGDSAFELSGFSWDIAYAWHLQEDSLPEGFRTNDVTEVLVRSASNITQGQNDCGLPDRIDATARYAGTTDEPPCVADESDGYNTIGFGELPEDQDEDTLAFVCTYGTTEFVVEADMLINSAIPWALTEDECTGFQELLEPTITHEFGHVFGLGHVSERQHGDLTMSPTSNGPCDAEETTLGLGDILGLEQLY